MANQTAIFAAGCFWGVQYYFDEVPGVISTEVGYTGGYKDNPTYEEVCAHKTGHAEATKIIFDPKIVSYETLLKHFFRIQDPTAKNVPDGINEGDSYRSAIFYTTDVQKKAAQNFIDKLNKEKFNGKIVTTLEPAYSDPYLGGVQGAGEERAKSYGSYGAHAPQPGNEVIPQEQHQGSSSAWSSDVEVRHLSGKWWPAEAYHQKFTARTGRGTCHVPYSPVN